jgi:hypothetical protein
MSALVGSCTSNLKETSKKYPELAVQCLQYTLELKLHIAPDKSEKNLATANRPDILYSPSCLPSPAACILYQFQISLPEQPCLSGEVA